jgi:Flp pilus assembly protein TadG
MDQRAIVETLNKNIGQKGALAVEFAIVLLLLLPLVFGISDVGMALYNKQVITNASREGARAGIARSTIPINTVVVNYCAGRLLPAGTSPSSVIVSGGGDFQNDLTVTVTLDHNFMFAGIVGLSPTITMTGETVMKMELEDPPPSP